MKKILILLLIVAMLMASLTSCAQPPEIDEIRDRLAELIEGAYEINEMFFGEGLPVYERVYDPKNNMKTIRSEDGSRVTYYYELQDAALGRVVAYRVATLTYSFAQVLNAPDTARDAIYEDAEAGVYVYPVEFSHEKTVNQTVETIRNEKAGTLTYYYELVDPTLGRVVAYRTSDVDYTYVQVLSEPDATREACYENASEGAYAYEISYTEPTYELYYTEKDPVDYDYVRMDAKYQSIAQMKEAASKVYTTEYLLSLYETLFVGTVLNEEEENAGLETLSARYYEYTDDYGTVSLMKSNTYKPLVTERRLFDLSTAKIVRPSRKIVVVVEIESYLESTPEIREPVRVTLYLRDGVWMLDSGTY